MSAAEQRLAKKGEVTILERRGVNGNILRALTRTGRFVCFFALALTLFAGLRSGILRGARAGYPADHL